MNIKATIDGVEQEFDDFFYWAGLGMPVGATHYFEGGGTIIPIGDRRNMEGRLTCRLIRPRHTFGGVVFEVDGYREPSNEWILNYEQRPVFVDYTSTQKHTILRPVAICE